MLEPFGKIHTNMCVLWHNERELFTLIMAGSRWVYSGRLFSCVPYFFITLMATQSMTLELLSVGVYC